MKYIINVEDGGHGTVRRLEKLHEAAEKLEEVIWDLNDDGLEVDLGVFETNSEEYGFSEISVLVEDGE